MPPFQMGQAYKKKSEGGRANYAVSEAMVAAYNSVNKKEMSANQASIHYRVKQEITPTPSPSPKPCSTLSSEPSQAPSSEPS